jgi:hypothetical protein
LCITIKITVSSLSNINQLSPSILTSWIFLQPYSNLFNEAKPLVAESKPVSLLPVILSVLSSRVIQGSEFNDKQLLTTKVGWA